MHFRDFLSSARGDLDREIEAFFVGWKGEIGVVSPHLVPLMDCFSDACRGGKRVRGALVSLGYSLFAADASSEIVRVGVGYEIFQTAILAHDDIIDKSLWRRGKSTLHLALGGEHYGMSQALCLGDIGFFLAFRLLSESDFPDDRKNVALTIFSQMILETGVGQLLDVELASGRHQRSMKDVMSVYRLKTAYYTVVVPLLLGAILAGAPQSALIGIREFGEHVGVVYQIQDDIGDIYNDITEGKNTVLIVKALERATNEQRGILERYYGKADISDEQKQAVQDVFIKTEVLSFARDEAKKYSIKAKKSIAQITLEKKKQVLLSALAEYFM